MRLFSLRALIAFVVFAAGAILVVRTALTDMGTGGHRVPAVLVDRTPRAVDEPVLIQRMLVKPAPLSSADVSDLRSAIDHVPLSAAPYFLLGASAAAAGNVGAGERLVDAALERDPRLLAALIWKVKLSVETGRYDAAGAYAIRLAAIRPAEQTYINVLVSLSSHPEVRRQVFVALARNPDWRSGYLRVLSANNASNGMVYKALGIGNPNKLNLASERAAFLDNLVARQDYERAYTAWLSWLPDQALGAVGYIYDGDFAGAPGGRPFNWVLGTPENATVGLGQGNSLTLNFDISNDAVFADQLLVVPPGRYRLLTKIGAVDRQADGSDPALIWQMTCVPSGTPLADTAIRVAETGQVSAGPTFEIAENCRAQHLSLKAKAQSYPARIGLTIMSVAIRKVP